MSMRMIKIIAVISLLAMPLIGCGELEKSDLDVKKISRTVAYSLPVFHLNGLPFDENIATNAFNLFIDSLDPAHSYFLQTDIDAFAEQSKELHKQLKKGDITFAKNAYAILLNLFDRTNS